MEDAIINKVVGGCRLIVKVGAGGMGTVYKAHHLGLNKTVAVKILPPSFAREPERVKRFVREARAAAQLEHSNIVQILNVGKAPAEQAGEPEIYFIIMQFAQGETMAKILRGCGKLPVLEATRIIRDMAKALGVAHHKGIIHRDVKPENIMVNYDGEVKLMDFGLARVLDVASHLSQPGDILGTPHYLAPEQAQSMSVDGRADIYSLGVTYYYALTGQRPFEGDTPVAVIMQHINKQHVDPRKLAPELPEEVCLIINKMMAKNPDKRYQNCNELMSDLDMIIGSGIATDNSFSSKTLLAASDIDKPAPKNKSRGMVWYMVGAAITAVIIGLMLAYMETRKGINPKGKGLTELSTVTVKPKEPAMEIDQTKEALDKRVSEFCGILIDRRYDDAIPYFNPIIFDGLKKALRARLSEDALKQRLKKLLQLQFTWAEVQGVKLVGFKQDKSVIMPKDWHPGIKEMMPGNTRWAEVNIILLIKSDQANAVQQAPQKQLWVLVNDIWYLHPTKGEIGKADESDDK
ncbi:MAG: serine/threonine-protein kinase [Candidatus Brocadiia bacterium]